MSSCRTLRTGAWTGLVLAAALVVTGCGDQHAATGPPTEETTVDAASADALGCGQRFTPPPDGTLTLTPRFPATARAGEPMLSGTVEVSGAASVRGIASPRADVFLVQGGRIVAEPMDKDSVGFMVDLAAGESLSLPGDAVLVSCSPPAAPLPAGAYELWTHVTVIADDGTRADGFGGPSSVTIV